jgi:hypothetical protein
MNLEMNLETAPQGEIVVTAVITRFANPNPTPTPTPPPTPDPTPDPNQVITRFEDSLSPPAAMIAPLDLFAFRPATRGEQPRS